MQGDKEIFAHLLKYVSAETYTRDRPLDLETDEALLRLQPILCEYFSRDELIELVGEGTASKILNLYHIEILQNVFLEYELQQVLHAFNEASIPLMLFKGPVLAYTIYPKPHLRTYHDLDAFIHPDDVPRAHELLLRMGYAFYNEYRVDAIDKQRTGYHFSRQHPGSPFTVIIELHTAPHGSEIGTPFEREALWKNANAMTVLGQPTITMSSVDHLLYLCWHYRFHGFTRLLWLYDLVMMLRFYGDLLDWTSLIKTARRQQLAATLYYCLSWCHQLFGVAIPPRVLTSLRPPLGSRLIVERIALTDVARALSVDRYQEQRLIARRAMVDTNIGLLKAGLRMLFPSPIALQKRYLDHSRLPLQLFFLFYFIHPWRTLTRGCRKLFSDRGKAQQRKEIS